ncbi:arf-GAP with GTPase, ANK repeat and PH domain-containing protein 4 isoform X2 [Sapajus apella]|uniref:Arf-GAP with GTPase, ANK repeat and PH domain-containing protein 4 isoform X2 n=1 Tax=Sapajus apella TaxID=9515 RepID=A0A6J3HCN8_SAPAP|nr:arf-GAP with GTPase, ANK repeat and PH domain-containing protein 4 isoform X2 [Sapajus apella]
MGSILSCCVCPKFCQELDLDEGSGRPPESEICEAAAEDTTAAVPTAAAVETAELTVEAGEGHPVHDICDGEMPEDRALESDPSDHPEAKKSQGDDVALESSPSEARTSQTAEEIGENSSTNHIHMDRFSLKFSSCSTIFVEDSTASLPHLKTTLKS